MKEFLSRPRVTNDSAMSISSWSLATETNNRGTSSSPSNSWSWSQVIISTSVAALVPMLIPGLHMIIFSHLWSNYTNPVDTKTCSCSCWDTVFKGPYESGIANYKHVYFNATWRTFEMWGITVFTVLFFFESTRKAVLLGLNSRLRINMALVLFSSFHSHYYSFWSQWNYWNDDFYTLWAHQLLFTVSELFSTILVLCSLDTSKPPRLLHLILIANISIFHILSSGVDQFASNVLRGQGFLHQVLRDIALMSTDFFHAGVAVYEIYKYAQRKGQTAWSVVGQRKALSVIAITTGLLYIFLLLIP